MGIVGEESTTSSSTVLRSTEIKQSISSSNVLGVSTSSDSAATFGKGMLSTSMKESAGETRDEVKTS